jgi:hypothetical protein
MTARTREHVGRYSFGLGQRVRVKDGVPMVGGQCGTLEETDGLMAHVQLDAEHTGCVRIINLDNLEHAAAPTNRAPVVLDAEGYATLADVLRRAFDQAAHGKGKERHATAAPFEAQGSQLICDLLGTHVGQIHQATKKSAESLRLPHDAAVRELLGAIVYTAGAVIALERLRLDAGKEVRHA